jgi:uncharacterized protein YbdZ (MbtH family)
MLPLMTAMPHKQSEEFGVIVNEEHQFMVWPLDRRLSAGWLFAGPTGTAAEMVTVMRQQSVETAPAIQIPLDTPFSASQWADTASGVRLAS